MEENNYSANVSPSLLVKHYDCKERQNLQRYNLVAVDECEKSTSTAEHNHALVKLYARATSQEIPAFFCENKKTHEKTMCQKEHNVGEKISADRKLRGNTQERYIKADPEECMRHVRVLNGTGIPKLDNLQSTSTFTVLERDTQTKLEKKQGKLEVREFNTHYYLSLIHI